MFAQGRVSHGAAKLITKENSIGAVQSAHVLSRSSLCLDMPTIYGPSADIDPGQAYLFQCDDNGLFAASRDPTGGNLPRDPCAEGVRRSRRALLAYFFFR